MGQASDRQVPRKPRLVGGVKGHNINEISFPGSPALCLTKQAIMLNWKTVLKNVQS